MARMWKSAMKWWWLRSWRLWCAVLLVGVPLGAAGLAEWFVTPVAGVAPDPSRLVLCRWNKFLVVMPKAWVWMYWGRGSFPSSELRIYDAGTGSMITTHHADDTVTMLFHDSPARGSRWQMPRGWVTAGTLPPPIRLADKTMHQPPPYGGAVMAFVSLWTVAAVLSPVSLLLTWRAWVHRPRRGCARCGYSREGLPEGVACPECGWGASRALIEDAAIATAPECSARTAP
jgi:hypothetical protein